MPVYTFKCSDGHRFEAYMTMAEFIMYHAMRCVCGSNGEVVITAPMLVKAAQDVCYDSPVDGRPITNWDARREDLKRNNSRPYDPAMKQDQDRRVKDSAQQLDKAVDEHVERAIEHMPTAKRAKLHSELVDKSADVAYARDTSS